MILNVIPNFIHLRHKICVRAIEMYIFRFTVKLNPTRMKIDLRSEAAFYQMSRVLVISASKHNIAKNNLLTIFTFWEYSLSKSHIFLPYVSMSESGENKS